MGFYDLQSAGGFGSVGLALAAPVTALTLSQEGESTQNSAVAAVLASVCQALQVQTPSQLVVESLIESHAGLGSGTQLTMALGAGLNALLGLGLTTQDIAQKTGRGRRSGIGIAAFTQGGFLVDAGRSSTDAVPQVLTRLDFPKAWHVILVQDSAHIGVHGDAEKTAFQTLKPAQTHLRDMIFKQLLPALERHDLLAFGAYMADLQTYNGDYFAPIQGGHYASQDVAQVMQWLTQQGVACVGQSSWGPTGFAIVESESLAQRLCQQAAAVFQNKPNISLMVTRACNHGAQIEY